MSWLIEMPAGDVFGRLAVEEALLDLAPSRPVLFLWRSDPSVVIGKNQVAWMESRPGWLRRHGVALARRLSGGGGVYHDPGNLNFSLVLSRAGYDPVDVQDLVVDTLAGIGVRAQPRDRGALFVAGRKCTGQAFCFRRGHVLHHGTFLVRTDLEKLDAALVPCDVSFVSRAIRSRRAAVMNLSEVVPGLTPEALAVLFKNRFLRVFGAGTSLNPAERLAESTRATARLRSWEWCFGEGPDFEIRFPGPAACPKAWHLTVREGTLDTLQAGEDPNKSRRLMDALRGWPLIPERLAARLRETGFDPSLAERLAAAGF